MAVSQYPYPPSPYQPPMMPYSGWNMPPDARAAGRSAAIFQIVIGALLSLGGLCVGGVAFVMPMDRYVQAMQQQHAQLPPVPQGVSAEQFFKLMFAILGGGTLLVGALLLIFSIFVYRGGKISAVFSIILVSIVGLIALLNVITSFSQAGGNMAVVIFALFLGGGLCALCGITIAKLFRAFKAGALSQAAALHQQTQYWMMMQQQAAGQGYGYGGGYGYPPQAAPPQQQQLQPQQSPAPDPAPRDPPPGGGPKSV